MRHHRQHPDSALPEAQTSHKPTCGQLGKIYVHGLGVTGQVERAHLSSSPGKYSSEYYAVLILRLARVFGILFVLRANVLNNVRIGNQV